MRLKMSLCPIFFKIEDGSDVFNLFVILYNYYLDRGDKVTARAIRNLTLDVTGLDVKIGYSDQTDSDGNLLETPRKKR